MFGGYQAMKRYLKYTRPYHLGKYKLYSVIQQLNVRKTIDVFLDSLFIIRQPQNNTPFDDTFN